MKLYPLFFFLLGFLPITLDAQLAYYTSETSPGYTLFESQNSAYLVNNCGEVVNIWNFVSPKYHPKLMENGNLVYIEWVSGKVKEQDWDGNLVNEIELQESNITLDYEVIVMPNGNYLCVGRMGWTQQQFLDAGFDFGVIGFPHQTDVVVEIDRNSGEVVWLWNIIEHVVQQRDENAGNYGIVKDNPQLLNMDAISTYDWQNEESFMINGMDYNAELDQIVLSIRKMGEIVIIDHSTTTEEAAGHTGGNSGMGGDILYRWGNPVNYDRGEEEDQYLFYQHNPNWIEHGEHKGKIIIYNNGLNRPGVGYYDRYSTVPIIDPPLNSEGRYEIVDDMPFAPTTPSVDYSKVTTGHDFYSNYTSAAKVMANGNVLVSVGGDMRVFEIKPDGEVVWEYTLPNNIFLFRAEKYDPTYPAFDGRDLTPMGTIENPPSPVPCDLTSSTKDLLVRQDAFKVWTNAEHNNLIVEPISINDYEYSIYDITGQPVKMGEAQGLMNEHLGHLTSGVYIIQLINLDRGIMQTNKFRIF